MYSKHLSAQLSGQSLAIGTSKLSYAHQPLKSEALFDGKKELQIEHAGEIYKLRLTSLGKLILTK